MDHDVILIQSMAHMKTRKTIIEKYFHIVNEPQTHSIGFMNGSSSDTLVIMRLSKKEMSKNGNLRRSHHLVNIVVEPNRFFENDATSELAKMANNVDWLNVRSLKSNKHHGSVHRPCGLKQDGKWKALSQLREEQKRRKADKDDPTYVPDTVFYPEIPLCLFCTCFVVLFLKDGKHNSLSLPIVDPTIEITSFVKSLKYKVNSSIWKHMNKNTLK